MRRSSRTSSQASARGPNQLDAFAPYLRQRWEAGCHNAAQLFRQIQEQGFEGAPSALRPYLAHWRVQPPVERGRKRGQLPHRVPTYAIPSPRCAAWLLLGYKAARDDQQKTFYDAFGERLCQECEPVKVAQTLALDFLRIVRGRRAEELTGWITTAAASEIAELQGFCCGLVRDKAAVLAGLSLSWSNGPVEGNVNRLKCIKRRGYGRANFDLLRRRVLQPP